jgi:hypothetical protein
LWKKESNLATQWVALRGKPLVEKKRAALEKLLTRISDLCLFYWEVEKFEPAVVWPLEVIDLTVE